MKELAWVVWKCEGTGLGCLEMWRNWLGLFGNVKELA